MTSVMLGLTARYFSRLMLLVALWFFLKGHNTPGGGFIAGLLFSASYLLHLLAGGVAAARRRFRLSPLKLGASGLALALFIACVPLAFGLPLLTGAWIPTFELPLIGAMHIGTPLLFDLGVMLTVIGFVISVIFDLESTDA